MENIKTFKTVNYIIELVIPDTSKDLKGSKENNINVYDENGIFLWNISELLKNYSDKFCTKYYDELYFDIRILDKEMIFCIGFNNHCEIDLKNKVITRLVCNR